MAGENNPSTGASGAAPDLAAAMVAAALKALGAADDVAARIVDDFAADVAAAVRGRLPGAVADALRKDA